MCSLSSHSSPPLNPAHTQYARYKCPNCSYHGQRMYLIQPQQQSIESQCWCLLLMCRYIACAHNSFYHFRMVVLCITFGLLAVAAFVESINTYSWLNKRYNCNCYQAYKSQQPVHKISQIYFVFVLSYPNYLHYCNKIFITGYYRI